MSLLSLCAAGLLAAAVPLSAQPSGDALDAADAALRELVTGPGSAPRSLAAPMCRAVPDPKKPYADCRYQQPAQPWAPPSQSEWSRSTKGERASLVNIYLHGSLGDLKAYLSSAGWYTSLPDDFKNASEYVLAAIPVGLDEALRRLLGRPDTTAESALAKRVQEMPISDEFFCGAVEAVAFEKNNHILGGRDHFRIFRLGRADSAGVPVWALAASRDINISHAIEHDVDHERDFVISDLRSVGAIAAMNTVPLSFPCPPPPDGSSSGDGKAVEIFLKPGPPPGL